ncbi:hypothetical protein ILUMI_10420 [Ignelater luminosus]|uniref:Uncharacterized protein n=1 Tax=Ignelater luminosus TaxID=2038154 RepID=A0A8K0G8Q3_IGNLU|nr:hypothetical protein ILUMI_10420 [Ignelater luminosus]
MVDTKWKPEDVKVKIPSSVIGCKTSKAQQTFACIKENISICRKRSYTSHNPAKTTTKKGKKTIQCKPVTRRKHNATTREQNKRKRNRPIYDTIEEEWTELQTIMTEAADSTLGNIEPKRKEF